MSTSDPDQSEPESPHSTRREVRASIKRLEMIINRVSSVLDASDRLRPLAARQLGSLIDAQIDAELDRVPLAELRRITSRGTRLGPLEAAGFTTAASVLNAPTHRLTNINGVGQQTIDAVRTAAVEVRKSLASEIRFRFDPDRPDAGQTALLGTLAAMRSGSIAEAELADTVHVLRNAAVTLVPVARPATRVLFVRRATKQAGFVAARRIDALLADNHRLIKRIDEFARLTHPDSYRAEQLWDQFREEAASFYSLLSTMGQPVVADDDGAAHGYIDDAQVRRITELELDKKLLTSTLRGYQEFGVRFALHRRRALIGDEMGLGKTVQALAVCAHLAARGKRSFLVVCPASVLLNWLTEVERHTRLTAHKLHGDGRENAAHRWLREGGVAVTTFDTLGTLRSLEGVTDVAALVVDEAHYIKNPETKRSRTVLRFIDRSERVMLLSGTPMENRVGEFRDLVAYLSPRIAKRIGPDLGLSGAEAFRRKVAEVYLRRNQVDVLHELPKRIQVEDWTQFTPADLNVYRGILSEPATLGTLERLRYAAYQSTNSAKLDRVLELAAEAVEDGLKVVIFSRFLDVLKKIRTGLDLPVAGTITGQVPVPQRQHIIDAFARRTDAAVLLCQIDTGGTGVNLQAASVAIITEPQWKPSTEEQAIARLYRMGQTRTVQVHRVLAKASVDELLREVQDHKRLLFDEFARKSVAKDADRTAVDTSLRPAFLDDESIPMTLRVVLAEQHRTRPSPATAADGD